MKDLSLLNSDLNVSFIMPQEDINKELEAKNITNSN